MPSNSLPAVSLLPLLGTVRTRIFRTRTPRRGATNCTRKKEKEHHLKVGALFFSQKVTKAKARGKEKAKANQAKAKAIAKEKASKVRHPKVLEGV